MHGHQALPQRLKRIAAEARLILALLIVRPLSHFVHSLFIVTRSLHCAFEGRNVYGAERRGDDSVNIAADDGARKTKRRSDALGEDAEGGAVGVELSFDAIAVLRQCLVFE